MKINGYLKDPFWEFYHSSKGYVL